MKKVLFILLAFTVFACEEIDVEKNMLEEVQKEITFNGNIFISDYPKKSMWTVAEYSNSGTVKVEYLSPYNNIDDEYIGYNLVFASGAKDSVMLATSDHNNNTVLSYYKIEQVLNGLRLIGEREISLELQ